MKVSHEQDLMAAAPRRRADLHESNQAVIFRRRLDSNPLFLTGSTDTVHCGVMLDLETDEPTVVEIPPGSGPGSVNDAFFRFVADMGLSGSDQSTGGKYLIVLAD